MLKSANEEFIDFLNLFDIGMGEQKNRALVVPDLVLQRFKSSKGLTLQDMLTKPAFKKTLRSLQDFPYRKDRAKNKNWPEIPGLSNNVKLWVYEPQDPLAALYEETTEHVSKFFEVQHNPKNLQGVGRRMMQFQQDMCKKFPEYYMNFKAYGSEIYGTHCGREFCLNVNIELDRPDLDRLVNRRDDPFHQDHGEPYCVDKLSILGQQPEMIDSVFNTTHLNVSADQSIEYTFNTSIVTQSSTLIAEYVRLDKRVEPFLSTLKQFVRAKALTNQMSTYGFTIMALAYLVSLDPPVIPNLQNATRTDGDSCLDSNCMTKTKFWDNAIYDGRYTGAACRFHTCLVAKKSGNKDCNHVPEFHPQSQKLIWKSSNIMSLGHLMVDFLYYYGYAFDFSRDAVSLKHGGKTQRNEIYSQHPYVVEDPVISGDNLARGLQYNVWIAIFRDSLSDLLAGYPYTELMKNIRAARHTLTAAEAAKKYSLYPRQRKSDILIKCLLIMGLPKYNETTEGCDCDFLQSYFSSHGRVHDMKYLDNETMLISLQVQGQSRLGIDFLYKDKIVHLVELFENEL